MAEDFKWTDVFKSPRGGFTRKTLEELGVPWPPPKGWRKVLERDGRFPNNFQPAVKKPKKPPAPKQEVVDVPYRSGSQYTLWFWNDGECDHFFPTLDAAEAAAIDAFRDFEIGVLDQIEIECCATRPIHNHSLCAILNNEPAWMDRHHVYEIINRDGTVMEMGDEEKKDKSTIDIEEYIARMLAEEEARLRAKIHTDAFARHSDPPTSKAAAKRMERSKMEERVYQTLLASRIFMTSLEVSALMNVPIWSISPRFSPLVRKGFAEKGEKLGVNSNGTIRKLSAWRAIPPKPMLVHPVPAPVLPDIPEGGEIEKDEGV